MPLLLTSLGFRGGHSQSLEQSPRKHPGHLPPEIQSTPFLGQCKTLIPKGLALRTHSWFEEGVQVLQMCFHCPIGSLRGNFAKTLLKA